MLNDTEITDTMQQLVLGIQFKHLLHINARYQARYVVQTR